MVQMIVQEAFKITGRGYVLTGTKDDPNEEIRIGDCLRASNSGSEIRVIVKGIEMVHYKDQFQLRNKESIGILAEISDEEAKQLIGETLVKDR
jgi:translation elongation factor EF-Tu-like GTPase